MTRTCCHVVTDGARCCSGSCRVGVWRAVVINRLVWAILRAEQKKKLEQLWCALRCGLCVCVCARLTMQVLHIVQGMYVGNTVCTPGADEREGVGVQEVRNKRKGTMWFIRLVQIWPITWRVWQLRKRRGSAQEAVGVDAEIDKMKELSRRRRRRRDKCSSGREFAVNNEKRLPRHAPGKTKPQPLLKQTLAP